MTPSRGLLLSAKPLTLSQRLKRWYHKLSSVAGDLATYTQTCPKFCGFLYKTPESLSMGDWVGFRRWARHNHPIQYFFREYLTSSVRRWFSLREMRKWAKSDAPSNVLVLPPSEFGNHHSPQMLVEQSLQLIFERYIETKPFDHSDWQGSEEMAEKVHNIHSYYTIERPSLLKEIQELEAEYRAERQGLSFHERVQEVDALDTDEKDRDVEEDLLSFDKPLTDAAVRAMRLVEEKEKFLHDRDTIMLQMIVQVRSFMW